MELSRITPQSSLVSQEVGSIFGQIIIGEKLKNMNLFLYVFDANRITSSVIKI